ncbi:MAG TPA: hypothetical protein VKJ65_00145 [Phycisphaerae bacterium]|nr:hypothetical protein [Phycisphaerae bacterium]
MKTNKVLNSIRLQTEPVVTIELVQEKEPSQPTKHVVEVNGSVVFTSKSSAEGRAYIWGIEQAHSMFSEPFSEPQTNMQRIGQTK